jgi:hypothetical protein
MTDRGKRGRLHRRQPVWGGGNPGWTVHHKTQTQDRPPRRPPVARGQANP